MPSGHATRNAAGQIVGTRGLTEQQARFVQNTVNGLSQTDAARQAGYAEPGVAGYQLKRNPRIIAAIHAEQALVIGGDLANAALGVLRDILTGDHPAKLKLDAAKTVLDRAGHIAPKAGDAPTGEDKPLAEMSVDELEAFIRRGRQAVEQAAAPIIENDPTPQPAPILALSAPATD